MYKGHEWWNLNISGIKDIMRSWTDWVPKYVKIFSISIEDVILSRSKFKKNSSNLENDEIASLIENKFLTILFRIISRKLNKQKFFEKEELFKEIKTLLEKYLNGTDKILKQEWININIYHLLSEKDWAIDYMKTEKNWRKHFLSTQDFLSQIWVKQVEKNVLDSNNDQCFKSITNTSWAMCIKNILDWWKIIFYFDWYNNTQEKILRYLMEDLAFVIKEKIDEIDYKYTSRITWCKNRRVFNEHIWEFNYSVIATDLDNFKSINDTYWHIAWDEVLKKFWESLRTSVRKDEWDVIHLSWDEFCIMIKTDDKWDSSSTIKKILERIEQLKNDGCFTIKLLNKKNWKTEDVKIEFSMWICENKLECWKMTLEQCYEQADSKMMKVKPKDWVIYRLITSLKNFTKDIQIDILSKVAKTLGIKAKFIEN